MAIYSKQYCDLYDPSLEWEFDIEAIAQDMYREYFYPIVCEGLGFMCIHKDRYGKLWLAFNDDGKQNYYDWKRYETVMQIQKEIDKK